MISRTFNISFYDLSVTIQEEIKNSIREDIREEYNDEIVNIVKEENRDEEEIIDSMTEDFVMANFNCTAEVSNL